MSKRLLLLPALLLLCALALAACGGGDDETSEVEDAIETAATTTNPADCAKFQTQAFMEQTSQETGKAALQQCEKEAKDEENAKSAEVSNADVEGSGATGEVTLERGNALEGQTLEVALVKDGGQWKVNEIVKFTKFDGDRLVETFEREIQKAGEADSKFANCFLETLKAADQAEIEDLVFKSGGKSFETIAKECS